MVTLKNNVVTVLVLIIGTFLLFNTVVEADIPVHCLHRQVVGKWIFRMGSNDHDDTLTCGHKLPDSVMTMVDNRIRFKNPNFKVSHDYKITLSEPNIATDAKGNKGTWTMIYDEGFEVRVNGKTFFSFFVYVPKVAEPTPDNNADFDSICGETFTGWYHDYDDTEWGCFIGKKEGTNGEKTPSFTSKRRRRLTGNLRESSKNILNVVESNFNTMVVRKQSLQNGEKKWQPDLALIEEINNDKTRGWTAKVHTPFTKKSVTEMRQLLGTTKYAKNGGFPETANTITGGMSKARNDDMKTTFLEETENIEEEFPKSFDWRKEEGGKYMTEIISQGSCGSCYAIAATDMISIRLRIMTKGKDKTKISPQNVVSCSDYNQGCEGGYPFLVGKFGRDIGYVPEYCQTYTGADDPCKINCGGKPMKVYHTSKYGYIGGYYGACNEQHMMKELKNNGPIVVALNAPSDLFYYSGGIYTFKDTDKANFDINGISRWEKTNHAVLAVGWGEDDDGKKYWIIKNSWGASWGENGYFKLAKGNDIIAAESMAVAAMPMLPKHKIDKLEPSS